jgi:Holliday junction resolvase RusA-like endonuclease
VVSGHARLMFFTVHGEPIAKGRPRLSKFGTYTPEKTVNYENWVKCCFIGQVKEHALLEGPLAIHIKFYIKISESLSRKKQDLMLRGEIRPIKKPDTDNLIKAITDPLNNLAYKDDSQLVEMHAQKLYDYTPRTEVHIVTIGDKSASIS